MLDAWLKYQHHFLQLRFQSDVISPLVKPAFHYAHCINFSVNFTRNVYYTQNLFNKFYSLWPMGFIVLYRLRFNLPAHLSDVPAENFATRRGKSTFHWTVINFITFCFLLLLCTLSSYDDLLVLMNRNTNFDSHR